MSNEQSQPVAATEISFCPHLQIYHYRRADGSEYMFDTEQLKQSIDTLLKTGSAREAEFMAMLTAAARRYPHQRVAFDNDGNSRLTSLEVARSPEDEGGGEGSE
jgi:hypothetical protein